MIINEDFFDEQDIDDSRNMLSMNDKTETTGSSDTYIVFVSARNDVEHVVLECVFDVKVFYNMFNMAVKQCSFIKDYSIDMFVRFYNVGSSQETEHYEINPSEDHFLNGCFVSPNRYIDLYTSSYIYEEAKSALFVVVKCNIDTISARQFVSNFNILVYPLFNIVTEYDKVPDGYEEKERNKTFKSENWFVNGMCYVIHSKEDYDSLLDTYAEPQKKYTSTYGKYSFGMLSVMKNNTPDYIISKFYNGLYNTDSNDINSASYLMGRFRVKKKIQTFFDGIPYKHRKTGYGIPQYDNEYLKQNYRPLLFIDIEVDGSGDNYLEPLICNDISDRFIPLFGDTAQKLFSRLDVCFRIWEYDKNLRYTRVCSHENLNRFYDNWPSARDVANNKIDNLYYTQIGKSSLYVAFMIYEDGLYSSSNDISPYAKTKYILTKTEPLGLIY